MKRCIDSLQFLIINAVHCSLGSDLAFNLLCVAMFLFCSLLSGIFHQKMAVKYFSHMKFMKNTHCLQACMNYGIYQTGILCYNFMLFVVVLLNLYMVLLFREHTVCYRMWNDLVMAVWGSSWAVPFLM